MQPEDQAKKANVRNLVLPVCPAQFVVVVIIITVITISFYYFSHQRWVWAFRERSGRVCVNTTNGVERQNEEFKYRYLAENRKQAR